MGEYKKILDYYKKMYSLIDTIHFNSNNTKMVFEKYLNTPLNSKVIPITHSGISDHRYIRNFDKNKRLRLIFIGSEAPYKGLPLLKKIILRLNKNYAENFELFVYGGRTGNDNDIPNLHYLGKYSSNELSLVFENADLLVVPSIWFETFSLITLEAISYGLPVLVSSNVGAKDIIQEYDSSFVFTSEDDLYFKLKQLIIDRTQLKNFNSMIMSKPWNWSLEQHVIDLYNDIYLV